ncbi:beta-1,6-N-acetylglucosaminyltransferase [Ruegeria marisrubri]|nr:beta-1,6-N-acetylglucosaminyltransferase [Ruegeria marisrubri]
MKTDPRIAFLIAAHDRPAHLHRLLGALAHPSTGVFLHIDAKSDLASPNLAAFPNMTLCSPAISVHWGGISQVQATLALMEQAVSDPGFSHFVFISGSDYPLRPIGEIVEFFADNPDTVFMNAERMPVWHKPLPWIEYHHPQPTDPPLQRAWRRFARRALKPLARRDYAAALKGRVPYGGTCWWALPRSAVEFLLETIDQEPDLLEFFRNTHCPDETLLPTLMMNGPFAGARRNTLTWADWSKGGAHPATIAAEHIPALLRAGEKREYLFARKFPDDSAALLSALEQRWRKGAQPMQ